MPDRDHVDSLRLHIDAAHAAAEQLVREADARARAAVGDTPERGWDVAEDQKGSGPGELHTVVALLGAIKDAIPAELSAQLAEALRELLLAVRALIDWYIERLEHVGGAATPPDDRVEDIPIR